MHYVGLKAYEACNQYVLQLVLQPYKKSTHAINVSA